MLFCDYFLLRFLPYHIENGNAHAIIGLVEGSFYNSFSSGQLRSVRQGLTVLCQEQSCGKNLFDRRNQIFHAHLSKRTMTQEARFKGGLPCGEYFS